ncbi:carbon-phosphorus lyase complex subunit PhnI, partial [Halomonas ventosae]
MGYSVVRGGAEAMQAAEEMLDFVRLGGLDRGDAEAAPPTFEVIDMMLRSQRSAVDRIMAEAGFYAPRLAATALVQAEGDAIEASFILRSLRASLPRIEPALPVEVAKMRVLRRISSAFKEVPGGQYLGPTRDYTLRFLRRALEDELPAARLSEVIAALGGDDGALPEMPRVVEMLREMGLISQPPEPPEEEPVDITMQPLRFPRPPRSARLQALARGETGMLNGLAYSSLRGYGHV